MGFLSGIRLATQVVNGVRPVSIPRAIASPWRDADLKPIIASEALGIDPSSLPLTRLEALKVPSIAKGRAVLHSLIATRPLRDYTDTGATPDQPTWLYRTNTGVSPYMRMCMILDDLIFNEASLLAVQRGAGDAILDAAVVPYDRWSVDDNGVILVDDGPVDQNQVVYIPGPGPGLLLMACETIRAARDLDRAWAQRVATPVPPILLQETEDTGMTPEEVGPYVASVAEARKKSGVMFLPKWMNGTFPDAGATGSDNLYTAGRNALRLDIANYFNLPASLLDGSVAEASLTYSTQEGRRNEVFDYTIGYWTSPIEQALSLDTVVPRGHRVRFDFSDLLTLTEDPTGPTEED